MRSALRGMLVTRWCAQVCGTDDVRCSVCGLGFVRGECLAICETRFEMCMRYSMCNTMRTCALRIVLLLVVR